MHIAGGDADDDDDDNHQLTEAGKSDGVAPK